MRVRTILAILVAALATLTAYAGDVPVRAIDTKGLKLGDAKGDVKKPREITSADDLAKEVSDADTLAKLKKEVDFSKEKLLHFAWSGSGGDKLGFSTAKSGTTLEVTIVLQPGLTRDLRPHHALFVIPKDATWKFETGKPGK